MESNVFVLAVLCLTVVLAEFLVRKTVLRHAGTALLAIILTAVVANLGIIPTSSTASDPTPVYDFVFSVIAPVSIFWLLLQVSLRDVLKAGLPMLILFIVGSFATALGAIVAVVAVRGGVVFGDLAPALGGMFAGTYTGGSVNFNAVALHYNVMADGVLFGGAVVIDNIVTAVWISATLVIPRFLPRGGNVSANADSDAGPLLGIEEDTESLHPVDLGIQLALALGALWISDLLSTIIASSAGLTIPPILIVTTIALALAQYRPIARIPGARTLGMFAVYLFLAVIGAYCDIRAVSHIGALAPALILLTTIIVAVHAVLLFGIATVFRVDPDVAAVASQANIGGGASALALARSLGRGDLVLPAVLLGSLGNALGTYLGFWVAATLSGMLS